MPTVNVRGKFKRDTRHGGGRNDGVKAHNHRKGANKHRHVKARKKRK